MADTSNGESPNVRRIMRITPGKSRTGDDIRTRAVCASARADAAIRARVCTIARMRNARNFLLLLGLLVVCSCARQTQRQYLSGKGIDDAVPWEFFCSDGDRSGQWSTIAVPWC